MPNMRRPHAIKPEIQTTITIVCTLFYNAKYIETHIDNKVPNFECPIFIYDA